MQNNKVMEDEEALSIIKGTLLTFLADNILYNVNTGEISEETENKIEQISIKAIQGLDTLSVDYDSLPKEEQVKKFLYLIETVEEWYLQSKDLEE